MNGSAFSASSLTNTMRSSMNAVLQATDTTPHVEAGNSRPSRRGQSTSIVHAGEGCPQAIGRQVLSRSNIDMVGSRYRQSIAIDHRRILFVKPPRDLAVDCRGFLAMQAPC